jgi:hypothetical protein
MEAFSSSEFVLCWPLLKSQKGKVSEIMSSLDKQGITSFTFIFLNLYPRDFLSGKLIWPKEKEQSSILG